MNNRVSLKLGVLAVVGLLLFNFPLLKTVNAAAFSSDLPMMPIYLFVCWILFVTLIFLIVRRKI
jgi:ABC-type protease/lipase transport system fused ATPase/permease subunit